MQPGALRALEFDRDRRGGARSSRSRRWATSGLPGWHHRPIRRSRASWLAAHHGGGALHRQDTVPFRCARPRSCRRFSRRWRSRDGRSKRSAAVARVLPRVGRRNARRHPAASARRFRCSNGASACRGVVQAEIAQVRDKIDPPATSSIDASPELQSHSRSAAQATDAAARHARVVSARQGHGEVPAGSGRHRAQRPVRPRRPGRTSAATFPGIVHGASTSGASLFLEPLSTVEINNDIVALEEQEAEEVRRILLALTDAFRARAVDLQRTLEAATELDVLQARARFSQSIDGVEPALRPTARSSCWRRGTRCSRRRCPVDDPTIRSAGHRAARSPDPTPAARPWRSRRRGCSR